MNDLRCPWCHYPRTRPLLYTRANASFLGVCAHCGAHGPAADTEEGADAAWNHRTPETPPADPWRQAIDDALISHALDCTADSDDPAARVRQLVEWAATIALNPAVSERAQALIDRGRASSPNGGSREALHAGAIAALSRLMDGDPAIGTPQGDALTLLAAAIEGYERAILPPPFGAASPVAGGCAVPCSDDCPHPTICASFPAQRACGVPGTSTTEGAAMDAEKYDDVLLPFLALMRKELHANGGKGDRPGWLQMDRKTALLEIHHHVSKLQKAMLSDDNAGIIEYSADVANMAMMALDVALRIEWAARTAGIPHGVGTPFNDQQEQPR